MAAVLQAIHAHGLGAMRFTEWGVLAAPRFFGRVMLAHILLRYQAEGAWGMSPHVIPHRSLHSMSGTVSQALRIHGPNFGVGGGPGGVLEALRCATAMLHGDKVPGVWVVLTGWDPEPIPDGTPVVPTGSECIGVALALTEARPGWRGARLCLVSAEQSPAETTKPGHGRTPDLLSLEALMAALTVPDTKGATVVWQLEDGARLELERVGTRSGLAGPHSWLPGDGCAIVGSSGAGAENPL
jgi:hypothetical protein